MSSTHGSSKSKKGVRSFFRDVLGRSSSHLSTSSTLSPRPASQASISSGMPNEHHSPSHGSNAVDISLSTDQQELGLQSVSVPGVISAEHSHLHLPPSLEGPIVSGTADAPEAQPVASSSLFPAAAVITEPTSAQSDPQLTSGSTDTPQASDLIDTAATITNAVWIGLQSSLQRLRDNSGVFSHLFLAVGILLECFAGIEAAARNQDDYENLARELASLSESLAEFTKSPTPTPVTKSISSVSIEIEQQAKEIQAKMGRGATGRFLVAKTYEEDVVKRYRRIQSLFRQLQANLSVSAWSIANRQLVNTQLEALNPVKQATYDSTISSTVSRRKCTEGTRTKVLSAMDDWQRDDDMPTVYWMNGMAGTGKTTIACTFSERLERRELLAASFFCTRTSADCRNVTRIIPTIAYQLARYSIPFQSALHEILDKEPDAGSKNAEKQFERLLRDPLQMAKNAMPDHLVVVIDALDECDDHIGVEGILKMLFRYAPSIPLKFLVTSRPEPEIYKQMATHTQTRAAVHLHDIESSVVQGDIALYLKEELASMSLTSARIRQLVEQSGSLFIYAATLVRYIQSGEQRSNPHKRLQTILSMTPEATRRHAQIDALYTEVLKSALNEEEMEQDEMEDIRVVLRTVLFAQEPIAVETVAVLAAIDDPERVLSALQPLRSVLHQSGKTGPMPTLHTSFLNSRLNGGGAGEHFHDILEHGRLLAERCFSVMRAHLQFNICELQSSLVPDEQVDQIQDRIKHKIPPTLAYACHYWGDHLALAFKSDTLVNMLEEFLRDQLLFWMEVINLERQTATGMETLWASKKWLNQAAPPTPGAATLVEDAYNFVTSFISSPASQSTPHLYISSLPFCPQSSSVHKNYWKRTRGLLEMNGSLMERRPDAALATWNMGSKVNSVAYSPDGTRVAGGCSDYTVRILNAHNGTPLFDPLRGHTSTVQSTTFSPDGKLLASGSGDYTIRLWNAYTGACTLAPLMGHSGAVSSLAFSPNGMQIVSGSYDQSIRIWSASDGTLLQGPFGSDSNVYSVAFSPDGTLIASASGPIVQLWDSRDGTPAALFQGHTERVSSIVFTPDGTQLVSGSLDRTIRVWNLSDQSPKTSPFEGHTNLVNSVAVSPDGTRVASSSNDRSVRVWNIDDGTLVAGPFVGHTNAISPIAFSPDGTRVISGSVDRTIRVWSVASRPPPPPVPFQQHLARLSSIFLAGNNRIVSVSTDRSVWTWDLVRGEHTLNPMAGKLVGPINPSLPLQSPNFVFEYGDHSLHIVHMTDSSPVAGPLEDIGGSPTSFAFSSGDSSILAIAVSTKGRPSKHTIRVWDPQKGTPIAGPFHGHKQKITSLDISPNHTRIISHSSEDNTYRIWSMHNTPLDVAPSTQTPFLEDAVNSSTPLFAGWKSQENGWVTNSNSELLFWIPGDIAPTSLTPHTEYIVTKDGILHIPKWELLIGGQWSKCYTAK